MGNGQKRSLRETYAGLENPPTERWVREDLNVLRDLRLVENNGRGRFARWWLAAATSLSKEVEGSPGKSKEVE
jgi:hypothetical protein